MYYNHDLVWDKQEGYWFCKDCLEHFDTWYTTTHNYYPKGHRASNRTHGLRTVPGVKVFWEGPK